MYIGFQSLSTVSHFGIEMEMDERERARTYALPIVMSHFLSQPLFWFSKYAGPGPTGVISWIPLSVNSFDVEMDRIKNINMK